MITKNQCYHCKVVLTEDNKAPGVHVDLDSGHGTTRWGVCKTDVDKEIEYLTA